MSQAVAAKLPRSASLGAAAGQFYSLTKPRVVQLVVFCALIGMLLASPRLPDWWQLGAALSGIWLVAAAAAVFNCLIERQIDARMSRTSRRPSATGTLSSPACLVFSTLLCVSGSVLLFVAVNALTMWLTLATFVGYAGVYTLLLKPRTPQNIVIGGLSGAMPPVLGWCAVSGTADPQAWLLCLIIFLWTPPHFWALALYRCEDYRRSGLPMLPVTHGFELTRLHILLYTIALFSGSLLPFVIGMSGWPYLAAALVLGTLFVRLSWCLWRHYSDALARRCFRFSITYLSLLFLSLLIDHFLAA